MHEAQVSIVSAGQVQNLLNEMGAAPIWSDRSHILASGWHCWNSATSNRKGPTVFPRSCWACCMPAPLLSAASGWGHSQGSWQHPGPDPTPQKCVLQKNLRVSHTAICTSRCCSARWPSTKKYTHPHCPQFVRQRSLHDSKGHPILAWRPCWLTAVDLSHPG